MKSSVSKFTWAAASLLCLSAAQFVRSETKPNIVIMLMDDPVQHYSLDDFQFEMDSTQLMLMLEMGIHRRTLLVEYKKTKIYYPSYLNQKDTTVK